jgi:hypothetical protein|tara:strand:- start:494 stop:814 length:321 start_codon:yes stop_codon:yes gene_type:complete
LKGKKGKRHKREKESKGGKKKLFRVPNPKIRKRATFFCGTERSPSLLQKRDTQTTRSAFAAFAVFAVALLLSLKATTRRVDHTYISKSFFSAVGVLRNKDRKNKRR